MDMGVIEIVGARFRARAAAKAFRMLLVLWVERRCALRFSFSGLLRIVTCESGRDRLTEGGGCGCASRFSLSGLLRMVMCERERDWRTEDWRTEEGDIGCESRFPFSGSLRMVICEGGRDWRAEEGDRGCASRFSLSGLLRMVMCRGERDWRTEGNEQDDLMIGVSGRALAGFLRMLMGESEGGRYVALKGLGGTFS